MKTPRHILICGERGVGKSTLIERLLKSCDLPVYGFLTKRLDKAEDGMCPIYIYPAGIKPGERTHTVANLVGLSGGGNRRMFTEVFDTLGVEYLRSALPDGLIVMDELGFLEAQADAFTSAVLTALNGDIPVIAAVKAQGDLPFLNAVRAHENARLYHIDESNRDALYDELLPVIREWNVK